MRDLSRLAAALALAVAIAAGAAGCGGEEPNPPVEPAPRFGEQPNFVFVLTDDQDYESYGRSTMPRTWQLLSRRGTTFANAYDTTPLCCPSRATYLTGQYNHNNLVLNNKPGYASLDDKDNVLPVWLQRAGYQTAYVGKFLNGYESYVDDKDAIAPGWDRWSTLVGNGRGYFDFKLTVDGRQRKEVYDGEYLTDVLNRRAAELARELSGEEPFFLQVGQAAPHNENINANSGGRCGGGAVPPSGDEGLFAGEPLPNLPAVRERDRADKPAFVADLPALDQRKLAAIRGRYQCRLATLPAVDRGIAGLVRTLRATGELDETVFLFASDNGNFHGQHGIGGGKGLPYEEASHVPLVIRAPARFAGGGEPGRVVRAPVANIDVVPTLVDWAGTETCPAIGECRVMDGRSLVPLIAGESGGWPQARPLATEFDIGKEQIQPGRPTSCRYEGVRDGRWLYVSHPSVPDPATGICEEAAIAELYDHRRDPFELRNLAGAQAGARAAQVEQRLSELTATLADCAGIEGRDPEPESGAYCR